MEEKFIREFSDFLDLETEACSILSLMFEAVKRQRILPNIVPVPEILNNYVQIYLVGSVAEGNAGGRWLGYDHFEIEMDVMMCLGSIEKKDMATLLEPSSAGWCRIMNNPAFWNNTQFMKLLAKNGKNMLWEGKYISGKNIRDFVTNIAEFDRDINEAFSVMLDGLLGKKKTQISQRREIHGPAVKFFVMAEDINILFDVVVMLQVNTWPEVAKEWLTRPRHWPSQETVEEAKEQGFQLVPKPKCYLQDGELLVVEKEDDQWCRTFTLAEKVINQTRNRVQKLVYGLAKFVFYSHLVIKESEKEFSSYILKTCMMWLMESIPEEKWMLEKIPELLNRLFDMLFKAVSDEKLPMFFIPEVNILEEYPPLLLNKVEQKLLRIKENVLGFIDYSRVSEKSHVLKDKLNIGKILLNIHFKIHPPGPDLDISILKGTYKGNGDYEDTDLD